MIDYHCHILPGIDDGPSNVDESIQMARLLSESGFTSVYCTPHKTKFIYEKSENDIRKAVKDLQKQLHYQEIPLRLLAGREYCMDNFFLEYINDLMPLEGTDYVLIEIPSGSYQGMVVESITAILRQGLTPMIAHPERCLSLTDNQKHKIPKSLSFLKRNTITARMALEYSYQKFDLLEWLSGVDCAFQCNIGSLLDAYGHSVKKKATRLLNTGIYSHFGTDAHSARFLEKLSTKLININSTTQAYRAEVALESCDIAFNT